MPLPSQVFLTLLGLPLDDLDLFLKMKDGIIRPWQAVGRPPIRGMRIGAENAVVGEHGAEGEAGKAEAEVAEEGTASRISSHHCFPQAPGRVFEPLG